MKDKITRWIGTRRLLVMNVDNDGCCVTLTCAHHYAGNIIAPRQGFKEMGVSDIYETI